MKISQYREQARRAYNRAVFYVKKEIRAWI
jgi:hypothetical protein